MGAATKGRTGYRTGNPCPTSRSPSRRRTVESAQAKDREWRWLKREARAAAEHAKVLPRGMLPRRTVAGLLFACAIRKARFFRDGCELGELGDILDGVDVIDLDDWREQRRNAEAPR